MKIYEYIREDNNRTLKLFGITVLEQTSDYMTAERHQKFIGGIVTTSKVMDPIKCYSKKVIKIFGRPIIKRIEENDYRTFYVLGKKVRRVSLLELFKRRYFRYFDGEYDDIYILNASSGEAYLTLTYLIDSIIKKNGSKHPLLVLTQRYHEDIVKMICPDIAYVNVKYINLNIKAPQFKIDKYRFYMLYPNVHFKQLESDIKVNKLGKVHYFTSILKDLNLSKEDIRMREIHISDGDNTNMLEKVLPTGLNLDKFVLIAPEANSCKLYDEGFWCELINEFQKRGYDVFVNLIKDDIKLKDAKDYKTCKLSLGEAFALAKRAKRIVSLRSGFTEILLQSGVPIDVLYTRFGKRHYYDDLDINQLISGFGLSQIPFVDMAKIREFNMSEINKENCIQEIISSI